MTRSQTATRSESSNCECRVAARCYRHHLYYQEFVDLCARLSQHWNHSTSLYLFIYLFIYLFAEFAEGPYIAELSLYGFSLEEKRH